MEDAATAVPAPMSNGGDKEEQGRRQENANLNR